MKKIRLLLRLTAILTLIFVPRTRVFGASLIQCLGQEELILHRAKNTGPTYYLNQLFIDKFTGFGEIEIKEQYLKKICQLPQKISPTKGVSFSLLEALLLYGDNIFNFDKIKDQVNIKNFRINNLRSFSNETSIHIFFDYLSTLSGMMKHANCLETEIPEIKFFRDRFRYLEGDFPIRKLFNDKEKVHKIITKLQSFDQIEKHCQKAHSLIHD